MNPNNTRVYRMTFAGVYPHYIAKAEKKRRTKAEVDEIVFWLTGYDETALQSVTNKKTILKISSLKHRKSIRMFQKLRA